MGSNSTRAAFFRSRGERDVQSSCITLVSFDLINFPVPYLIGVIPYPPLVCGVVSGVVCL